jgi:phage shock protein PspC (stress-responsive transcriptional regulator)
MEAQGFRYVNTYRNRIVELKPSSEYVDFAFNNWFDFFWWDFDWFLFDFHWRIVWPVLLILFGVWYIYRSTQNNENETDSKAKKREFYRSKTQKMIGGVCGGLAEYWNVDVTLVRIGYALATIFTALWVGVIAYVVMLVAVKEGEYVEEAKVIVETAEKPKPRPRKRKSPAKAEQAEEQGTADTKEGGADE